MNSIQLGRIRSGRIWKFFGGIRAPGLKHTSDERIATLGIPSLITLPLERHLGPGGRVLVSIGDTVKAGQALTEPAGSQLVPLHASTSGTVANIGMHVLPHPSGFSGMSLTIRPDLRDTHVDYQGIARIQDHSPEELLAIIRNCGVEGLGGAMFQTAAKLRSRGGRRSPYNLVIINGAECEPVATCDDRLMQERSAEIVEGIEIIRYIRQPEAVIVAIEKNKPAAIEAMQRALRNRHNPATLSIIPDVYPSGASRNLIRIITGLEIPYSIHTSECGIVVVNVSTVFAVKQAVREGRPLIRRVITVDGGALGKQGNALVMLGTSVRFIMNAYRLNPQRHQKIIMGGPLMGFTLPSIDVPITKSTTCIFAPQPDETTAESQERPCIRCGRCARACPARLVPYQMYAYARAGMHHETRQCGISDCIGCGCCSYVCPSRIQLAAQFRREQAIQRLLDEQESLNALARERRSAKQQQQADEELVRQAKRRAALQRIAAAKGEPAPPPESPAEQQRLAAAQQRLKLRREQAAQHQTLRALRLAQLEPSQALRAAAASEAAETVQSAAASSSPSDPAPAETADVSPASPSESLAEEIRVLPSNLRKDNTVKHYTGYPGFHFDRDAYRPNLTVVENPPQDPERVARLIAEQRQAALRRRQASSHSFDAVDAEVILPTNLRKHHHRSI